MPTQIGKTASPARSFKTTMGMLVIGSIMRPRIFISTSIFAPVPIPSSLLHRSWNALASQAVRSRPRDQHIHILAYQGLIFPWRGQSRIDKVESLVLRGATDPLAGSGIIALHMHLFTCADVFGVTPQLDGSLALLEYQEAPGFFFLGNVIFILQRGSVGAL